MGITATTTIDANRLGFADTEQIAYTLAVNAAFVTHDEGILSQVSALGLSGRDYPCIVFTKSGKYSIGTVIRKLQIFAQTRPTDSLKNRVIFL